MHARFRFPNPVLVVGSGLTALNLVRYFGKLGADVSILAENIGGANFSKYSKRNFILRNMGRDIGTLKSTLVRIRKTMHKRPVIYPTSDLDALILSKLKEDISDDYHFVVGNEKAVRLLINKSEFYKALERHGLRHPTTHFPEDVDDAQRIGAELEYPVFVRPSITQLFNKAFSKGNKGFIARSPKELVNYYKIATRHGIEVMFQEIVPGPPNNSYQIEGCYGKDYRPIILFARQRLRIWPPDFGNTTMCASIPLTRVVQESEQVNQFLLKIGYSGVMSAEFKEDERDGVLKLLEINARPWWHFWLSSECGVPILLASYLNAIGEKPEFMQKYDIDVKSVHLLSDLRAAIFHISRRNFSLSSWVRSLRDVKVFAYFEKSDIAPLLVTIMKQGFPFLKSKISFNVKKTHTHNPPCYS